MSYGWWKFIHLAGVVGFVAAHGTSMAATVLMGRIREPQHVAGILQLSAATVSAFYVSTLILLVGGIGAGVYRLGLPVDDDQGTVALVFAGAKVKFPFGLVIRGEYQWIDLPDAAPVQLDHRYFFGLGLSF